MAFPHQPHAVGPRDRREHGGPYDAPPAQRPRRHEPAMGPRARPLLVSRIWQTGAIICLMALVSALTYIVATLPLVSPGGDSRPLPSWADRVAVIYVEGVMVTEDVEPDSGYISSAKIGGLLRQAADDPRVKAVVLRVDSPGGTPSAAQEINYELERARERKPVFVSMGELAASGAYYISAAADAIYATPDTMTGSIGVIWVFADLTAYYEEQGVRYWVAKSGDLKDMGASWRNLTEEEREHATSVVMQAFNRFVEVVAQGRNLSEEQVRNISDGRVYTGADALALGLVDGYADLYGTIELAARQANVTSYDVEYLNEEDVHYTYQGHGNLALELMTASGLTGGRAYLLYVS